MGAEIHPRQHRCREAEVELGLAISALLEKYDLTQAEGLRVINAACSSQIASIAQYAIRHERHGKASKPGGRS